MKMTTFSKNMYKRYYEWFHVYVEKLSKFLTLSMPYNIGVTNLSRTWCSTWQWSVPPVLLRWCACGLGAWPTLCAVASQDTCLGWERCSWGWATHIHNSKPPSFNFRSCYVFVSELQFLICSCVVMAPPSLKNKFQFTRLFSHVKCPVIPIWAQVEVCPTHAW